jgi:hypothetical protein
MSWPAGVDGDKVRNVGKSVSFNALMERAYKKEEGGAVIVYTSWKLFREDRSRQGQLLFYQFIYQEQQTKFA